MESHRRSRSHDSDNENENKEDKIFESLTRDMEKLFITNENEPVVEKSHKRKIIFLVPFPVLSKEEFDKYNKPYNTFKIKGFYFRIRPDAEGKKITYEHYLEVIEDLKNEKGKAYKKAVEKSYKKINEDIEVIGPMTLPTTKDALEKFKAIISNLQPRDQLYITAHGNMNLIASRPFAFYPEHLAKFLINLNIPDQRILIGIYACNSGDLKNIRDFDKGFSENVRNELSKLGYNKLCLEGVNGYLYSGSSGVYSKIKDDEQAKRVNSGRNSQTVYTTPTTTKTISDERRPGGFFTDNRNTSDVLVTRSDEEMRELAKPLFSPDSREQKANEQNKDEVEEQKNLANKKTKKKTTSSQATFYSSSNNSQGGSKDNTGTTAVIAHRPVTRSQTKK